MIDKLFVRIIFILIACLIFSNHAFAGLLADKTLLDSTLKAERWQIDGQVSYSLATETLTGTPGNMKWVSIADAGIDYFTYLNIPLRITYGLAEGLTFRLVLPYAIFNGKTKAGQKSSTSGLGNIEFETVYSFLKESTSTPSLSALLNIKGGTGKKMADIASSEGIIGSRSTDITLGLVAMKSIAALKTKLFLGYVMTTPYLERPTGSTTDFTINLTDQVLYALGIYLPMTDALEIGGELSGATSLGKEQWSAGGTTIDISNSNRDYLMFTPLLAYQVSDAMSIRGSADFVLSKSMATTINIWDLLKFTTYSVGATFNF